MSADDPGLIFTGVGASYDRVATMLSFGQDPRWRRAAVDAIAAQPTDRVLDVATGTGMVAQALHDRYGCVVVGLDQSADMLRLARSRRGVYESIVEGRAEKLPFPDASFDHLTFTYLLRYVADPAATLTELARVVKPGGPIASLEFAVPSAPWWRISWWGFTRMVLPIAGLITGGRAWYDVGRFLGPSITNHYRKYPVDWTVAAWQDAGIDHVETRTMSLGGGLIMWGRRAQ